MRLSVRMAMLLTLAACGDDAATPDAAPGDAPVDVAVDAPAPPPMRTLLESPVTPNYDLDLLFVIDDSSSMQDKQANLANNFPNFVNVLNTSTPQGLPNLHIGVITTDMGTKGTADPIAGPPIGAPGQGGCTGSGDGGVLQNEGTTLSDRYISDVQGTGGARIRNYTGQLSTVFGNMARGVGANGCGFEQPLHAMRRALENNAMNAGFLRASAVLGVVFLTDEDDCSITTPALFGPDTSTLGPLQSFRCTRFGVTCSGGGTTPDEMNTVGPKSGCTASTTSTYLDDVQPYRDFLVNLKGDARKVAVAAIMAPSMPVEVELRTPPGSGTATPALGRSCVYQGAQGQQVGDPGVRMQTFLDLFPGRSAYSTVCQLDLSGALASIAQLVLQGTGSPCLAEPLPDADPAAPGIQQECIVEDVVGATATEIPACGVAPGSPCYRFETDAATCPVADHVKLVVMRTSTPDPSTVVRLRCVSP